MTGNVKAIRKNQRASPVFSNMMTGVVAGRLQSGLPIVIVPGHDVKFILGRALHNVAPQMSDLAIDSQVLFACENGDPASAIFIGTVFLPGEDQRLLSDLLPAVRPDFARIDGRRVVLEAQNEIVLRCGKGSLTLTADGRIVMKGVEITTRALRKHKIKGGTVDIN